MYTDKQQFKKMHWITFLIGIRGVFVNVLRDKCQGVAPEKKCRRQLTLSNGLNMVVATSENVRLRLLQVFLALRCFFAG